MTFSHPLLAVCALAIVPGAYLAQRIAAGSHRRMALVYSNLQFLTSALRARSWPLVVLNASRAAGTALLLFAAAGPRIPVTVAMNNAAIAICIDTSGSMRTSDINPTREAAALKAVRFLVAGLPNGTKAGLVSFAGNAQVLMETTADHAALRQALATVPAPNGQTALGDALRSAVHILPVTGPRAIVLITDGISNTGEDPARVIHDLQTARVRLFAIGVGVNAVAERALQSYAASTGGSLARIGSAAQLPPAFARVAAATFRREVRDVSEVPALAGLLLLAAAWVASAWAGRLSFLGEPELHEPLGHLDDAPQLRRAGRDDDRRRADRIPARVD